MLCRRPIRSTSPDDDWNNKEKFASHAGNNKHNSHSNFMCTHIVLEEKRQLKKREKDSVRFAEKKRQARKHIEPDGIRNLAPLHRGFHIFMCTHTHIITFKSRQYISPNSGIVGADANECRENKQNLAIEITQTIFRWLARISADLANSAISCASIACELYR